MRNKLVILALFSTFGTLAWAQGGGWKKYEPAFDTFPCQDGWVGCIQDGSALDPNVQTDASGMPFTAGMRVSWFDLKPTSSFSPFVELSPYPGKEPQRIGSEPVADAGSADGSDADGGTDSTQDKVDDDAVAFVDPAAERARQEAESRRLAELEAQRAEQEAQEEQRRAEQEAARARQEAERLAQEAEEAARQAERAANEEERQRLEEQARRAREEEERAAAARAEAERVEAERRRQAQLEAQRAEEARRERERAEAERRRREEEEARQAAAARAEEQRRREEAEREAQRAADEARRAAEEAARREAEEAERRRQEAAAAAQAAADQADRERLEREAQEAEAARRAAEEEAQRRADEAARQAEEASRARAEQERQAREEEARAAAAAARAEGTGVKSMTAESSGGDGGCTELIDLETKAVLGQLSDSQMTCLEDSLKSAPRQTQKSKISRMLMVNAFSKGDTKTWEGLMKRHLNQIEQSDPDLCYKYALHLSKKGAGSAYSVIKWAGIALENRTVWTGSTYTSRVYSLYKMRAAAAQKIWQFNENKHKESPSEESNEKVKNARSQTKVFAREWYEYAKASGKDVTTALDLCMSAAGTRDYCEAG